MAIGSQKAHTRALLIEPHGYETLALDRCVEKRKGERHGQRRAKRQPGAQETQEAEDQDECVGAKPEDRRVAARLRYREEEMIPPADYSV
jgi:hypothetical protein